MSSELAPNSGLSSRRMPRSRSSSVTGHASPESMSSDSPPSSDPDIHPSFSNTAANKSLFAMEVDPTVSNLHMMDMDANASFDPEFELRQMDVRALQDLNEFHGYNVNFDDTVLKGLPNGNANSKSDMLMLEEIIKDGAFEPPTNVGPPLQPHSLRPPILRDLFSLPSPIRARQSNSQMQQDAGCINPSTTQHTLSQRQPPNASQAETLTNSSPSFKMEPPGVLLLSPASQGTGGASTPHIHDLPSSHSFPPCEPTPFALISSEVVHPPKELCFDLPIFFPSIPAEGTKSRVETQIKLNFELGFPVSTSSTELSRNGHTALFSSSQSKSSPSSSANSSNNSPAIDKLEVSGSGRRSSSATTHDKVGTYPFIRLPQGTATKRRAASLAPNLAISRCTDVKAEDTLEMTAEVLCCSPPHASVQSCSSCQSREAKRTARKLAARVRPPNGSRIKAKNKRPGKKGREQNDLGGIIEAQAEEDDEDEPNADSSIIQFNCAEIVDFGGGSVVLPMRITCYCRHHKEKIGFNIVFTLRDNFGRVVGQGTTPPILITDDHKSNNAVSKLPPMHPLRQVLNPPLLSPPLVLSDPPEEAKRLSPQLPQDQGPGRTLTKRHDTDSTGKKRRAKPYDGRPINRPAGVGPGIEGRQGLVLALHPAHAKAKVPVTRERAGVPTNSSSPSITASPVAESSVSPALRAGSLPPSGPPEKTLISHSPSLTGIFSHRDVNMLTLEGSTGSTQTSSPGLGSLLPTAPPSPSSLSSPVSSDYQSLQPSMQSLPDSQTLSSQQKAFLDSSSFPLYPSRTPTFLPKIHRLIPSSGPTTGGIEITVLGSNFHESLPLECVFGGAVASSTHRWSENTLVCVLPPRAAPGVVGVGFNGVKEDAADEGTTCLFNYVDESDRQLMELALQVVGLKMTGKIEEARNVAMRIVGNTNTPSPTMAYGEVSQLSGAQIAHHSFIGSLGGMDLETLIIKLLTLLDVPPDAGPAIPLVSNVIGHQNATGQTLLHLSVMLALPALVSCLAQRSIDIDACNSNGLTALHFAALTGWKEGAEILLAAGADASIIDRMGFTAADRARGANSPELERLLEHAREADKFSGCGSGEEGDDEAWHDGDGASEDSGSEADHATSWPATAPPQYSARSRLPSRQSDSSPEELSESRDPKRETSSARPEKPLSDTSAPRIQSDDKHPLHEKRDASFVGRLQRTLPQGILPNMQIPGLPQLQIPGLPQLQIPGLPQLQIPDMLTGPWGALPHIPVFPVFVPIPNLPHLPNWPTFPWADGEKKENRPHGENAAKQQQPPFAMLWTAYDNINNNAWRAQWEKWTAQVTALQNANSPSEEQPPMYTPREQEKQVEAHLPKAAAPGDDIPPHSDGTTIDDTLVAVASTSRLPQTKATRRMGHGTLKMPGTVDSPLYQPEKSTPKKDRMFVFFWIPILFIGVAYALYTTLPVAIAGVSRATRRLIPQLPRREENSV